MAEQTRIIIKPHHFMDIIKLYGAGLTHFVRDEAYGHDFYKVANQILADNRTVFQVTVDGDAICIPCRHYSPEDAGVCEDTITHIDGCTSKDAWNKVLDKRIIAAAKLDMERTYTAYELCRMLYGINDAIFTIWAEDDPEKTKERHRLFCLGAETYLAV